MNGDFTFFWCLVSYDSHLLVFHSLHVRTTFISEEVDIPHKPNIPHTKRELNTQSNYEIEMN